MKIKTIVDENFGDYKLPSIFISSCYCDWKCARDGGFDKSICQNSHIAQMENINIGNFDIYNRYRNNPITKSVVIGGLEPIVQINDILRLISTFRVNNCNDPFIIYTGYREDEIQEEINKLLMFENIYIKFGRYIPDREKIFDENLGVFLSSDNQYSKKIC